MRSMLFSNFSLRISEEAKQNRQKHVMMLYYNVVSPSSTMRQKNDLVSIH